MISPNCSSSIREAFTTIQKMGTTQSGRNQISSTFKLCSTLQDANDVNNFVQWLEGGLEYMAMIDYPYPNNFLMPVPGM
jgi:lysosomal Pro-X carboxypeptidase